MKLRWTLGRALLACLVVTGALVAALTTLTLSAWERSIASTAHTLQAAAAARATALVDDFLGHLRRVVSDVERRRSAGVCDLGDSERARACLVASVAPDDVLAEATFTSAQGWQSSAWRDGKSGALCTTTIAPGGRAFLAIRRCGDRSTRGAVSDPRANPTYETPAAIEDDRVIWSDLSYAALDADLPEAKRRVVVHALRAVHDPDGKLLGVLRVALLERQLDEAFAKIRVNEDDPADPFHVFLADEDGRLITRFRPSDRVREIDDDLRIAPDDVPPAVASALAHGSAPGHIVSFADLPGTQSWRVGIIGPDDYYSRAQTQMRRRITAAAIAVLLLVAALLAWVTRVVGGGLRRVVGETERMRRFELAPAASTTAFADVETVLAGLERAKTAMRALGKYAPIDLVRRFFADNVEPALGGELRRVTLLFTDIKDFTTFAESLPPERLAALLGRYFEVMTAAVAAHGGTVDKYIGDALMVLWNAPVAVEDHAARACRAALACVEAARALCASDEWRGLPVLTTRFGIHTAEVMVGHFGAPERFSYTALGDGVNLASRLEGLNKQYGTTILVSAAVADAVRGEFDLRPVDRVTVKGKTQAVDVFELRGMLLTDSPLSVLFSMPILDGPWVTVDHDQRAGCVDVLWKRFTPSRELRAILANLRVALGAVPPPPRWFLDHTRMKVVSPEDQSFILDGWIAPWTAALPCRGSVRVAFVNALDVFGRRSVERLAARLGEAHPKAAVAVFHGRGAAREWLMGNDDELAGSNPA